MRKDDTHNMAIHDCILYIIKAHPTCYIMHHLYTVCLFGSHSSCTFCAVFFYHLRDVYTVCPEVCCVTHCECGLILLIILQT